MNVHVQFLSLRTDLVLAERFFPEDTIDLEAQELAQILADANHEPVFAVTEWGDTLLAQPRSVNSSPFRDGLHVHDAYTARA